MSRNRGRKNLKRRRQRRNPMGDFDALPIELRHWLARAVLPWSAASARRVYEKALRRKGRCDLALEDLDRLQQALIARDARRIWGEGHPAGATGGDRA